MRGRHDDEDDLHSPLPTCLPLCTEYSTVVHSAFWSFCEFNCPRYDERWKLESVSPLLPALPARPGPAACPPPFRVYCTAVL